MVKPHRMTDKGKGNGRGGVRIRAEGLRIEERRRVRGTWRRWDGMGGMGEDTALLCYMGRVWNDSLQRIFAIPRGCLLTQLSAPMTPHNKTKHIVVCACVSYDVFMSTACVNGQNLRSCKWCTLTLAMEACTGAQAWRVKGMGIIIIIIIMISSSSSSSSGSNNNSSSSILADGAGLASQGPRGRRGHGAGAAAGRRRPGPCLGKGQMGLSLGPCSKWGKGQMGDQVPVPVSGLSISRKGTNSIGVGTDLWGHCILCVF